MKTLTSFLLFYWIATQLPQVTVEGSVIGVDTGQAIENARVELARGDGKNIQVSTDRNGRFRFNNVEAGSYRLLVRAPGYVTAIYGQRGPDHPGVRVTVGTDKQIGPFPFKLVPAATVAGDVRDFDGEPLANVLVLLFKGHFLDDRQVLTPVDFIRTDDRGSFRLYWVTPGRYFLSATYAPDRSSGFVVPANPNLPVTRGGYLPTYYPGVTDARRAEELFVKSGEVLNVSFQMTLNPTVRISGTVTNGKSGRGAQATVRLVPAARSVADGFAFVTQSDPSGYYQLNGIPPGLYGLNAVLPGSEQVMSYQRLEVAATDIAKADLILEPGIAVTGRILIEGQTSSDLRQISIRPVTAPDPLPTGISSAQVRRDGSFTLANLRPGAYRLRIVNVPDDLYAKSASLGGDDALGGSFAVHSLMRHTLEIVLSSGGGKISGTVAGSDGSLHPGAEVILIPRAKLSGRFSAFKRVVADDKGGFRIGGIEPGEYAVLAFDYLDANAQFGSDLARRYDAQAQTVEVAAGSEIRVNVALTREP